MESTESKRLTPTEQARTQIRNIIRSLGLIVSEHSACGLQELEDVLVEHFAPVFERAQVMERALEGQESTLERLEAANLSIEQLRNALTPLPDHYSDCNCNQNGMCQYRAPARIALFETKPKS